MNKFEFIFVGLIALLLVSAMYKCWIGNLPNDKPETKPDLNRSNESVSTALSISASIYINILLHKAHSLSRPHRKKKRRSGEKHFEMSENFDVMPTIFHWHRKMNTLQSHTAHIPSYTLDFFNRISVTNDRNYRSISSVCVSVWATSMYYITTALIMGSCRTNLIYIMPSVPGDYHFNFGVAKFFSACLLFNKLVRNEI